MSSITIDYDMVMDVTMSWDRLKNSMPHYEEAIGELVFLKLVELQPDVLDIFGIDKDEDVRSSKSFLKHTKLMVRMVDTAINDLGPDAGFLAQQYMSLGARHYKHGVQPMHMLSMCKAIFYCLDKFLASEFSDLERKSWELLLKGVVAKMVKGHHKALISDKSREH